MSKKIIVTIIILVVLGGLFILNVFYKPQIRDSAQTITGNIESEINSYLESEMADIGDVTTSDLEALLSS